MNIEMVTVSIYGSWLCDSAQDQAKELLHELLHIPLSLIADYARDQINILCPTDEAARFNKTMLNTLAERHESATQDLTKAIYARFRQTAAE